MNAVGRNRKQLIPVIDRPRRFALASELCALLDRSDLDTLAELAAASGVHVATVRRALNADSIPEWTVMRQIADTCGADARSRYRLEQMWLNARLEARPAWYRPGPLPTGHCPRLHPWRRPRPCPRRQEHRREFLGRSRARGAGRRAEHGATAAGGLRCRAPTTASPRAVRAGPDHHRGRPGEGDAQAAGGRRHPLPACPGRIARGCGPVCPACTWPPSSRSPRWAWSPWTRPASPTDAGASRPPPRPATRSSIRATRSPPARDPGAPAGADPRFQPGAACGSGKGGRGRAGVRGPSGRAAARWASGAA